MKHYFGNILALTSLILGSGLVLSPNSAAAQAPAQVGRGTCDEAQILFISDQSGSMSELHGDPKVIPPTDPQGARFDGVRAAIEQAGVLRLRSYLTATIKVAVVHFGDSTRTQLPWTTLEVGTDDDLTKLMQIFASSLAPVSSMGNTNQGAAFQYASSLFNQVRSPVGGCPIRLVMVLTDGEPYLDREGFSVAQHLADLVTFTKQYMPSGDFKIYVAGLDKNDYYWTRNVTYWQQIAGDPARARRVASVDDLNAFLIDALTKALEGDERNGIRGLQTLGSDATIVCVTGKTIDIPPYQQQVRLTYIKSDKKLTLDVADETGQLLSPLRSDVSVKSIGRDTTIEVLEVARPKPGRWTVQSQIPTPTSDSCKLRLIRFDAVGKLVAPGPSDKIVQFKRAPIRVQLVDASGASLPAYSDPKYALRTDFNLTRAGSAALPMTLIPTGTLAFAGDFLPLEAGTNQVLVKAQSRNVDGSDYTVFDKSVGAFGVEPVSLALLDRPAGAVPQYRQVTLRFGVQAAGQPVDLDLKTTLSLSITGPAGTLPFTQSALTNVPGGFVAGFTPDKAGNYTIVYRANVDLPSGRQVTLTEETIRIEASPATLVRLKFVEPSGDAFIATDYLNRPTGLPLQVMLVDEGDKEVNPSSMGVGDVGNLFQVKVVDPKTKETSTKTPVRLVQTNGGNFRLDANTLGAGAYEVRVDTSATLNPRYVWETTSWTRTVVGQINPLVFALLGAVVVILLLVALLVMSLARAMRHPLSGSIHILMPRTAIDDEGNSVTRLQEIDRWQLNRRWNSQRLVGGLAPGRGVIQHLRVRCESAGQATSGACKVYVKVKGQKLRSFSLLAQQEAQLTGSDLRIAKNYKPRSTSGSAATYSSEGSLSTRLD